MRNPFRRKKKKLSLPKTPDIIIKKLKLTIKLTDKDSKGKEDKGK